MSKEKLVVIDADSLIYSSSKETLGESIQILNDKIQNIYDKTEATHSVFLISKGKYFRHDIYPAYKQNRNKYTSTLKWLKTLKCYLEENYNAYWVKGAEADDICAYLMSKPICIYNGLIDFKDTFESANCILAETGEQQIELVEIDVVLAAIDKDLLKSIVGHHFSYSYVLEDKTKPESVKKGWWVTTSKEEAYHNFWVSMVTGDVSDNIKGCAGKGVKYAEKLFDHFGNVLHEVTLSTYMETYGVSQGIYEFQKNYRLLHLLSSNADFMQELGETPLFPTVNKIEPKPLKIEYI